MPIDVDIKTYKYIGKNWGNDLICLCFNDFPIEREKNGFKNDSAINTTIIKANEIKSYILKYKDDIHIVSGFSKNMIKILKNAKVINIKYLAIIAEKPYKYFSKIKEFLHGIYVKYKYNKISKKYNSIVKLIMAMGKRGVNEYSKFKWDNEKIHEYMYCSGDLPVVPILSINDPIKFVYIGRFNVSFKGVDVLIDALRNISIKNWEFDFIGFYGELLDEVKKLADEHTNIRFVGNIKHDELLEKLKYYDCIVVPSRCDGWNLNVNHAINSGLAVIATSDSVSGELIKSAQCGILIEKLSAEQIMLSIETLINNPSIILEWKKNSINFSNNISDVSVGNYFINMLDYYVLKNGVAVPKCPWESR